MSLISAQVRRIIDLCSKLLGEENTTMRTNTDGVLQGRVVLEFKRLAWWVVRIVWEELFEVSSKTAGRPSCEFVEAFL
jgi:hypothetical protein